MIMNNQILQELKRYKKMLYTVDMVNGFTKKGPLHDETILTSVPEQIKLLEKFKREREGIGFIQDSHSENCEEFKRFPKHCVKGTYEAELIDELKPYEQDSFIYLKNSTNAIFAPNMMDNLEQMPNLEEVVIAGCLSYICVNNFGISLKNYFEQYNRDIAVYAVKQAIANIESTEKAYQDEVAYYMMEQNGIIIVDNIEELNKKEMEHKTRSRKRGNE